MAHLKSPPNPKATNTKLLVKRLSSLVFLIFSLLIIYMYLDDLGKNPYGLFCDEAEIGFVSHKLITSQTHGLNLFHNFPFFYNHLGYILGNLPVFTTAPFTLLFGLNDFSVRLPSSFFMLANLLLIYLALKKLRMRKPELAVLLFALTPFVIHMARINWGHSPALFFILLGYMFYLYGKERFSLTLSILAGLSFGISAYGYPGFLIAAPVFVVLLTGVEVAQNKTHLRQYRQLAIILLTFFLAFLPVIHLRFTSPDFFRRLNEKNSDYGSILSQKYLIDRLTNYPKYYSFDYLFSKGEVDLPGAFITRHSVRGSGMLLPATGILLILSLLALLFHKHESKPQFILFFLLFLVYPLPDLITTKNGLPPYSFSVFSSILFLPFLMAFALDALLDKQWIDRHLSLVSRFRHFFVAILMISGIISGFRFYFSTYQRYPLVSADYWGWQSGPKEMIGYFNKYQDQYDEFYMDGMFNQPQIFLDFYILDPSIRQKAFIGGLEQLNPDKKQLFGVRKEIFDQIEHKDDFLIKDHIYYPNGLVAFYLVTPRL